MNENYPICEFCGCAIPDVVNYCPSCGEEVMFVTPHQEDVTYEQEKIFMHLMDTIKGAKLSKVSSWKRKRKNIRWYIPTLSNLDRPIYHPIDISGTDRWIRITPYSDGSGEKWETISDIEYSQEVDTYP